MLFNMNWPISFVLNSKQKQILNEIENYEDKYILNVNEEEFINYLHDNFLIEEIKLYFDNASYTNKKIHIWVKDYFGSRNVEKTLIRFEIPIQGNYEFLKYSPSSCIMASGLFTNKNLQLNNDILSMEIMSQQNDNFDGVNREYEQIINIIKTNTANINSEISMFNNNLKGYITNSLNNRKKYSVKKVWSIINP